MTWVLQFPKLMTEWQETNSPSHEDSWNTAQDIWIHGMGCLASSWNVKKTAVKIKGIQAHWVCNVCYSFNEIILKTYRWLRYTSMCLMHPSNLKPWEKSVKDSVKMWVHILTYKSCRRRTENAHQLAWPLIFF